MYFSWKLTSTHNPLPHRVWYACYEGYVCLEAVCVWVGKVDRQGEYRETDD